MSFFGFLRSRICKSEVEESSQENPKRGRGRTKQGGGLSLVHGEPRSVNSTTELICSEATDPSVLPHIRGLATSHLQGLQRIMGVQGEEVLQPEGNQDPSSRPWVTCTQVFCLISVESMRTDYEVYRRIRADSSLVGRGDSAGPSHWPTVRSALMGCTEGRRCSMALAFQALRPRKRL